MPSRRFGDDGQQEVRWALAHHCKPANTPQSDKEQHGAEAMELETTVEGLRYATVG